MNEKTERLNEEETKFLITLIGLNPNFDYKQIQTCFLNKFNRVITDRQIGHLKKNSKNKINEIITNDSYALELAQEFGFITLTSKVKRLQLLEILVRQSIEGYDFQMINPKGMITTILKKDFPTAITALKLIKEEAVDMKVENGNYIIQIGEVIPSKVEEEIEGDEDL